MYNNNQSSYKWYILVLAALTHTFAVAIPSMSMPVLFKEISEELSLSLVQIGTAWGVLSLAGVFVVVIGGLLGDRFGVKRILSIACILAGLTGALRGLSESFISLTASMFLFGLITAIIPPNVHNTCSIWFPRRQLGLANGVVSVGMAVGFMAGAMISATILSPLLGGWRNVIFLYGAISFAMSIPWLLARSQPNQLKSSTSSEKIVPLRQAVSQVVHIKGVWLLGVILLGQIGCVQGMLGYLPIYLRNMGWTPISADSVSATFHAASLTAAIPIAILSDRLGTRKSILFVSTLMTAVGVGLLSIADGVMVWVAVIIAGIVRDGFMAVFMTMTIETEGVGSIYAGTAVGLVQTFARLGSFISPPLGNSIAGIDQSSPFIFWAALAALASVGFHFVKETGWRVLRTE